MIAIFHIAVAMKPLGGNFAQNGLNHGVAGLNIDAARISMSDALKAGSGGLLSHQRDGKAYPRGRGGEKTAEKRYTDDGNTNCAMKPGPRGGDAKGRWPANVILGHPPGCRLSGTERVRSPIRRPNGKPIYNTDGKAVNWNDNDVKDTTIRTYADDDGMESVDAWDCKGGCPVRLLGEQSGDKSSTRASGNPNNPRHGSKNRQATSYDWNPERESNDYRDTGTAARFFKQVAELDETVT
jgi:hypothetical protein